MVSDLLCSIKNGAIFCKILDRSSSEMSSVYFTWSSIYLYSSAPNALFISTVSKVQSDWITFNTHTHTQYPNNSWSLVIMRPTFPSFWKCQLIQNRWIICQKLWLWSILITDQWFSKATVRTRQVLYSTEWTLGYSCAVCIITWMTPIFIGQSTVPSTTYLKIRSQ